MRKVGVLKFPSPWLSLPGFSIPESLKLDVMHIRDLGTNGRLISLSAHRLCQAGHFPGETHEEKLKAMMADIRKVGGLCLRCDSDSHRFDL